MADKQLEQLLTLMPDIATVVNKFASPAAQTEALWILVMAAEVDLDFVDWEHPGLRRNVADGSPLRPWVGLDDLLSEERRSAAYRRLGEAELRASEPGFAERALADSRDAEGLRELAAQVAKGKDVTFCKS